MAKITDDVACYLRAKSIRANAKIDKRQKDPSVSFMGVDNSNEIQEYIDMVAEIINKKPKTKNPFKRLV